MPRRVLLEGGRPRRGTSTRDACGPSSLRWSLLCCCAALLLFYGPFTIAPVISLVEAQVPPVSPHTTETRENSSSSVPLSESEHHHHSTDAASTPLTRVCALLRSGAEEETQQQQQQLAEVFQRFRAVPDRRGGEGEEAGRSAEVRFVAVVHSLAHPTLPAFLLSLLIAGTPIELLGLGDDEPMSPLARFEVLEAYLAYNAKELKDSDVVVLLDTDAVFTGHDFMPVVEKFVNFTARTPEEMDVHKIRAEQQYAPFLLSTQVECRMEAITYYSDCLSRYRFLDAQQGFWAIATNAKGQVRQWVATSNAEYALNHRPYLNTAAVVARVWALREMISAMKHFTATRFVLRPKALVESQVWKDDRSILSELFTDLTKWEFKSGVLTGRRAVFGPYLPPPPKPSEYRLTTPEHLTPGLLGRDLESDWLLVVEGFSNDTILVNSDPSMTMNLTHGFREVFDVTDQVVGQFLNNETVEVRDAGGVVRNLPKEPLKMQSPTGVPLAAITLRTDTRSNANRFYHNWTLDGSEGVIDISMPFPSSVPLGVHFNTSQGAVCTIFHPLMPWGMPLYAENSTSLAPNAKVDASKQPQLSRILRVLANAPPIKVWRHNSTAPDPRHTRVVRSPLLPDVINFSSLCEALNNTLSCV